VSCRAARFPAARRYYQTSCGDVKGELSTPSDVDQETPDHRYRHQDDDDSDDRPRPGAFTVLV
jgi:hypothetical protein